jgi:hypothetical protein
MLAAARPAPRAPAPQPQAQARRRCLPPPGPRPAPRRPQAPHPAIAGPRAAAPPRTSARRELPCGVEVGAAALVNNAHAAVDLKGPRSVRLYRQDLDPDRGVAFEEELAGGARGQWAREGRAGGQAGRRGGGDVERNARAGVGRERRQAGGVQGNGRCAGGGAPQPGGRGRRQCARGLPTSNTPPSGWASPFENGSVLKVMRLPYPILSYPIHPTRPHPTRPHPTRPDPIPSTPSSPPAP